MGIIILISAIDFHKVIVEVCSTMREGSDDCRQVEITAVA